jgi:hypothetical protein
MKREIPKFKVNGDLSEPERRGNNKPKARTYLYESNLYIESCPDSDMQLQDETASADFLNIPTVPLERLEAKGSTSALLTRSFLEHGARECYRNKATYVAGKHFWAESRGKICAAELKKRLWPGFVRSDTGGTSGNFTETELDRTINNIRKSKSLLPLSKKTLIQWGLIDPHTGQPNPHAVGAPAGEVSH